MLEHLAWWPRIAGAVGLVAKDCWIIRSVAKDCWSRRSGGPGLLEQKVWWPRIAGSVDL